MTCARKRKEVAPRAASRHVICRVCTRNSAGAHCDTPRYLVVPIHSRTLDITKVIAKRTAAAGVVGGAAVVVALAAAALGAIASAGSGHSQHGAPGSHAVGAPGPAAGAGLPGIIVVGAGAYWLVRRHRRKSDSGLPRGDLKD
jgi:hypothetical protein